MTKESGSKRWEKTRALETGRGGIGIVALFMEEGGNPALSIDVETPRSMTSSLCSCRANCDNKVSRHSTFQGCFVSVEKYKII